MINNRIYYELIWTQGKVLHFFCWQSIYTVIHTLSNVYPSTWSRGWSVAKCTCLRQRRWWRWADFWQRCSLWCTTARLGWEELPGCHQTPVCNAVWCKKQEWIANTMTPGLGSSQTTRYKGRDTREDRWSQKMLQILNEAWLSQGDKNGRQMLAYLLWIDCPFYSQQYAS